MSLKDSIHNIIEVAAAPNSFSIYACIGVVVTTVLAIGATKKLCDNYYEKVLDKEEFETDPEKPSIKETAKALAPAIVAGAVTLFCISKANSGWMEYNSMINSAFVMSQHRLQNYMTFTPAVVAAELQRGLGKQRTEEGKKWFCVTGVGNLPDIYFQATNEDIWYAMYHTNRNFQLRGTSSVGEFFAFLPIDEKDLIEAYPNWKEEKDIFGWDTYEMAERGLIPWLDFNTWHTPETDDTPEISLIGYVMPPSYSSDGDRLAYSYSLHPTE